MAVPGKKEADMNKKVISCVTALVFCCVLIGSAHAGEGFFDRFLKNNVKWAQRARDYIQESFKKGALAFKDAVSKFGRRGPEIEAVGGRPNSKPASSGITGLPELPQLPKLPKLPQIPQTPKPPQLPQIPRLPEVTQAPQPPQIPRLPEVPEVPEVPQAPEPVQTPNIPVLPSAAEQTNPSAVQSAPAQTPAEKIAESEAVSAQTTNQLSQ